MSRQTTITDAAITTLAAEGMRGLTHRAVDRTAGLPEGSTSYYFRTRLALLVATVERLAELDDAELPALTAPDPEAFAHASAAQLHRWMTTGRHRQLARYELALEATRRPALRQALTRTGARVREMVAELLTAAGVTEPEHRAHELAALMDGLLFDQIAGAGQHMPSTEELTATIGRLMKAMGS